MIQAIADTMPYFGLLGQVALAALVLLYLAKKLFGAKAFDMVAKRIKPHAYLLAFIIALLSTLGSLFLSEVVKFQPCVLCWYQRVMMYPQAFLYYIALIRQERFLRPYTITLSTIGMGVGIYQWIIQRFPGSLYIPCSTSEFGVSCVKGYHFTLGYISYPLVAATAFALLIVLMLISDAQNPQRSK